MRIGVKPGQWGWSFDELLDAWTAADEAGFDVLSCFDHVTSAQAASDGRVEVGLGAGSFHLARHDHRALGIPFPALRDRLRSLESIVRVFPRPRRGETVDDETLGLEHASLGATGIDPPRVVVGGTSEAVISIAVRHADGWNASADDPEAFARILGTVDEAARREARDRPLADAALR